MRTPLKVKKAAFSLLEIAIAIFILSLVGSVIGAQVSQLIGARQFQTEVSDFSTLLQEAQVLAMVHQTDFTMEVSVKKNQWTYRLVSDEPLGVIDRKEKVFKAVHFLTLNGQLSSDLKLKIFSSGRIEPHPLIGFHVEHPDQEKGSFLWLDLQTPILIKRGFGGKSKCG